MKQKLVALTGAGISAESGLRTFRDGDGLWESYRIEEVATPEAWLANKEQVLRFYNERRRQVLQAMPNAAHQGIAALEEIYDVTVITQNIDDLHERAGSRKVLHLHGEILKMRSERNELLIQEIRSDIQLGDLAADGAQLRPHVVWFGEAVPQIEVAIPYLEQADIFVLVGSSLAVYPAAGLVDYVAERVPRYIIDPHVPPLPSRGNFQLIAQPATTGVAYLTELLERG